MTLRLRAHHLSGLVAVLWLAASGSAWAQSGAATADLVGTVQDESKAVVPGAQITATNTATGVSRTVTSGPDGRFTVPALPVGTYTVQVELSGFGPQRAEVVLAVGTTVDVPFTLKIAAATEQVTVMAETPIIDVQKTAVGTDISQHQIENLPINGRNFISFSVITPGVAPDNTPQQGASATSGLTFAGQRARSNNITVDGLDNNDAVVGSVRATFSQEAVREFQVLTNSYTAEFGKASGGVVNIVTKSGTNTVGGDVFFYLRDKALNARGHFEDFDPAGNRINSPKAPYNQKQFGATIGGPIRKDRTFYFLSFERLDVSASNFVTIDDATPVRHPVLPVVFGTPAQILRNAGFPVEVGNVPYAVESNQFLAKIDHHISSGHTLTARFNAADTLNENIEPFGGLVAKSRAAALDSRDIMAATTLTSLISTTMVNDLRVQVADRDQKVLALDPRCAGPCDAFDEGGPTLEVTGFASVGRHRFTPQPRRNTRFQVLDTFAYYAGRHQIKTGVDFSYINNRDQALPLHFGGRYIFRALPLAAVGVPLPGTLSAIQAVALGVPAAYVQGYGDPSGGYKYSDISLFAQDDWRLTDRVTLKAGVRYQKQSWDDITYSIVGYPGSYGFPSDGNNIAPRVAVAWDPAGDKMTSVHASYGIFYDNHITGIFGITDIIDGQAGVRTFAAQLPDTRPVVAWNAPNRRLPEAALGAFPSLVISIDPGLDTPYAHHASAGIERQLAGNLAVSANVIYARGFDQLGTIDYNPVVRALAATGRLRPADTPGRPLSTASVLQYTSFGETWYKGLTLTAGKRFAGRSQFLVSYTVSEADDNSTDFQSAFIPQNNGVGRDPNNPNGLPIGFNPDDERGPSLQDQRHRFVFSGLCAAPYGINLSAIVTVASGRPFPILAGDDLNGDANGGAFPPDRPWRTVNDLSTTIGRNAGRLPVQASVDLRIGKRVTVGEIAVEGLFEVFNLFNRVNYTDVNNIFGTGAYPSSPVPTFGQFTQAGPPRQIQ
ncbi:MAG: TonB-dependent receptor, partial [Acidobacteria bacterium]|nr:TonB-dependent receptor [Acidobacteriota bacterium]